MKKVENFQNSQVSGIKQGKAFRIWMDLNEKHGESQNLQALGIKQRKKSEFAGIRMKKWRITEFAGIRDQPRKTLRTLQGFGMTKGRTEPQLGMQKGRLYTTCKDLR